MTAHHRAAPAWDEIHRQYHNTGLILPNVPFQNLRDSGAGLGLAYLAAPYATRCIDPATGRFSRGRSDSAATEIAIWMGWLAINSISAVCPALDIATILRADLAGAMCDLNWQRWGRAHLRASRVMVIAPMQGWRDCPDICAAAAEHLAANRVVITIKPGTGPDV